MLNWLRKLTGKGDPAPTEVAVVESPRPAPVKPHIKAADATKAVAKVRTSEPVPAPSTEDLIEKVAHHMFEAGFDAKQSVEAVRYSVAMTAELPKKIRQIIRGLSDEDLTKSMAIAAERAALHHRLHYSSGPHQLSYQAELDAARERAANEAAARRQTKEVVDKAVADALEQRDQELASNVNSVAKTAAIVYAAHRLLK